MHIEINNEKFVLPTLVGLITWLLFGIDIWGSMSDYLKVWGDHFWISLGIDPYSLKQGEQYGECGRRFRAAIEKDCSS